eukprot:c39932_g1_i1 orf=105-449(+)
MWSTGIGIQEPRCRQYGSMENEVAVRQALEWQSRRSMKGGEKKKPEGCIGGKSKHVTWKSLVVKLVLLLTLAASLTVLIPNISFHSQNEQTLQQLRASASHAEKVAWMTRANYI